MIPSPPSKGNSKERSNIYSIGFNFESDIQSKKDDCTSKGNVVVIERNSADAEVFCFDKLTNLLYLSLIHAYEYYSKSNDKIIIEKDVRLIINNIGTFLFGDSFGIQKNSGRFINFLSAFSKIVVLVLNFIFASVAFAHKQIKEWLTTVKQILDDVNKVVEFGTGIKRDYDTSNDSHEDVCEKNDYHTVPFDKDIRETKTIISDIVSKSSNLPKIAEVWFLVNERVQTKLQTAIDTSDTFLIFQKLLAYGLHIINPFLISKNENSYLFAALCAVLICPTVSTTGMANIRSVLSSFKYTRPLQIN